MQSEKNAFGDLVENYHRRVFQVALSILGDKDEALNITQEVFMKAFRSYRGFRFDASPETWLVRITVNKVRDHLRKERLRRLVFAKPGTFSDREVTAIADEGQSPEEMLRENQFRGASREGKMRFSHSDSEADIPLRRSQKRPVSARVR